jgi:exopolyphosphatase/guanosine-5'-triphosphate,3'-diphosphate pyrophosphatase
MRLMHLRFGSVDIGTGAVQHLIADIQGPGDFAVLEMQAEITRLGDGVDSTGLLADDAQRRTLAQLRVAAHRFRVMEVEEAISVGTSALRDARNQQDFAARLRAETGFTLRVLSTEEEAHYSFLAASKAFDVADRRILVMDLGGGSTEIMWGTGGSLIGWVSLQLGSIRLTNRFAPSDPITDREYEMIRAHIDSLLSGLLLPFEPELLIGMAGTFHTLSSVAQKLVQYSSALVHGSCVGRSEVQSQVERYREATIAEREGIQGIDRRRAAFILAGVMIAERAMNHFGIERVQVSDHGLNYGLLHERIGTLG